jgi:biopolymer transport protein ExbD
METRILGILCCCFAALLISGGPFIEQAWSEEPLTQGDVAEPIDEEPATEDAPADETRGAGFREFAPKTVPKIDVKEVESVYTHLLNQYAAGEARGVQHLELLNAWSLRVYVARVRELIDTSEQLAWPEIYMQGLQEHGKRMQAVERLVGSQVRQGRAPGTDLVAARVLRTQALQSPAQVKEMVRLKASHGDYEVKFPAASEAKPLTERPPALTVDVAEDGTLTVDGQIVSHQELDEMLRQYARNHPGQGSVVIRADRRGRVQNAVDVMEACSRAGVKDYTIETVRESRDSR